ncbi:P2X purinoceptor 7-like [Dysidea avara]|uniref:P2X purinoceptor 7-like n=1 Tax=Dysidea avara TaxID=196820 RepID=UPI00331691D3
MATRERDSDDEYDRSSSGSTSDSDTDNESTSCSCKNTCQRKKCPCQAANAFCSERCTCGTRQKSCKNKPVQEAERPAGENAMAIRRQQLEEFVTDLDSSECKKLIVAAYENVGGLELAKALLSPPIPDPPQGPSNAPHWCKCGKCRSMPQPSENVCCKNRVCVTTSEVFRQVVLDPHILAVCIVSRSTIYADVPDYSSSSYRWAGYRQWQCGYLGSGNRKVIPSCVVWAIRDKYPAPDGIYLGYRSS